MSGCVHSVDVDEVGLPSPLLTEVQFVDCVISARFSLGKKSKSCRRQLQLRQFTLFFLRRPVRTKFWAGAPPHAKYIGWGYNIQEGR